MTPPTKPSGIPWLGEVPAHWEVKRADAVLEEQRTMLQSEGFIGREVFHYSIPSIQETGDGAVEEGETIASAKTWITKEVLLVSKLNPRKGTVLIGRPREQLTVCSGEFIPLVAVGCDLRYAEYVYRSEEVRQQMDAAVRSVTRSHQRASSEDIRKVQWAWPPLPEQRAIAAFLDERTARIDALVARKRRLVQLLKEKRQALITRAVTRGLDPKVKMKESGVPWLGEVPEGWEVKPLRSVGTFQNGISAGADYFGSGYPFVNYKDVYQWPSLPEQVEGLANSTDIDQERYSVREGDIFFTRTSETNEEIGFASTCLRTMEHATFSGFLIRVRPHRGLLAPNFSKHFFRSDVHRAFFVKEMNLVTRASLGQELLKRLPVLLPPVVEQIAIAEFLDDRLNRLDVLVTKVEQAVERLQEYRTALISAAVTGKVRIPMGRSEDQMIGQ